MRSEITDGLDLAGFERLLSEATPGPWSFDSVGFLDEAGNESFPIRAADGRLIADASSRDVGENHLWVNASLICLLREEGPRLVASLRRACDRIAELEERLGKESARRRWLERDRP